MQTDIPGSEKEIPQLETAPNTAIASPHTNEHSLVSCLCRGYMPLPRTLSRSHRQVLKTAALCILRPSFKLVTNNNILSRTRRLAQVPPSCTKAREPRPLIRSPWRFETSI